MQRIAIVVFEQGDLLDIGGPYEVFLTANRLVQRDGGEAPFDVVTIGRGPAQVYGGLRLVPQASFDEAGDLDVVIVPGAVDIDAVRADRALMADIERLGKRATTLASVCTGAFLLAETGLLPDSWTTHWEDIGVLEGLSGTRGTPDVRWVDRGAVVTSGGLSSGIAMALHLVARFEGLDLARRTARQIDYDWDPSGRRTVA